MAGAALLYALLFSTSFYVAWMFAATCLIVVVTAAIMLRHDLRTYVTRNLRPIGILAAVAVGGFLVGLIPFRIIYGPCC